MILPIVKYGHPVLRQRGRRIETITDEVRQLAASMLETMHDAQGVGLAAQQVGQPLMLLIVDVSEAERPSTLEINGVVGRVEEHMPMILLNPAVSEPAGEQIGGEGCLSFPGLSADIKRAEAVTVTATSLEGKPMKFRCTGLLSRAIQHELDHLNGVLFIDRMDSASKAAMSGSLKRLMKETEATLKETRKPARSGFMARTAR